MDYAFVSFFLYMKFYLVSLLRIHYKVSAQSNTASEPALCSDKQHSATQHSLSYSC